MVMSAAVVRCPSCEQPSRVPTSALGLVVACPRCQHQFTAVALAPPLPPPPPRATRPAPAFPDDDVPVVQPRPRHTLQAEHPDEIPTVHPPQTGGGPIALALLPLGVPLLWLILTLVAQPSEFSFMAPLAIALGNVGLGLGLAMIRRWSIPLRMRLLVALAVLGYGAAALFYFATPGWVGQVREVTAVFGLTWRDFRPDDKSFRLEVPGEPTETPCPVDEWRLTARQFVDQKNALDLFVVAYGDAPTKYGRGGDQASKDKWFDAARDAVGAACGGALTEERVVSVPNCDAREYVFELGSGKRRVVRLVRADKRVVYLGVEGPYMTADQAHVQKYLQSFRLTPQKK